MKFRRIFGTLVSIAIVTSLAPDVALACVQPIPTTPVISVPTEFDCEEPVGTDGVVTIVGRQTFGGSGTGFCACGLGTTAGSSVITSVDSVTVVLPGTTTPHSEFGFAENVTTTAAFNAIQAANWTGFFGAIGSGVVALEDIDIRIELSVIGGTTCAVLVEELNDQEAGLFGTDEANSDGTLTGGHQSINAMKAIDVVPALGAVGLLTLAIVVAVASVWLMRRSSV